MIQAEIQVCIIDNKPVELSEVYEVILQELGQEDADRWTKLVLVPQEGDP